MTLLVGTYHTRKLLTKVLVTLQEMALGLTLFNLTTLIQFKSVFQERGRLVMQTNTFDTTKAACHHQLVGSVQKSFDKHDKLQDMTLHRSIFNVVNFIQGSSFRGKKYLVL